MRNLLTNSRTYVLGSGIAGLVGGLATAGVVAVGTTAATRLNDTAVFLLPEFAGLLLVALVGTTLSSILQIRLTQRLTYKMRMTLCSQIVSTSLRQLENVGAPRLLAALTEDVRTIAQAIMAFPILLINGAIVLGCSIYLYWLSPQFFGAVFILVATGIVIYQRLGRRATHSLEAARALENDLLECYRGITEGVKELLLHRRRRAHFFANRIGPVSHASLERTSQGLVGFAIAQSWTQFLYFGLIAIVLFALPIWTKGNIGIVPAYISTLMYSMMPLSAIVALFPMVARAAVALRALDSLGLQSDASGHDIEGDARLSSPCAWRHLELRGVTYDYGDRAFSLGPLNLELRPHEIVFIVGGNGAGKSTFARVLTGLYTPTQGQLLLDGSPVTDESLRSYREYFGAVFADYWLFDHLPANDDLQMQVSAEEYLRKLRLEEKLTVDGGRFSTVALSQGQRRRLALVAALADDRPIYLFDEWAADQDLEFKQFFYCELLRELRNRGKAVIVISHDDRYFGVADRLFKLEAGRLELLSAQTTSRP